jgi:hypothetical protein
MGVRRGEPNVPMPNRIVDVMGECMEVRVKKCIEYDTVDLSVQFNKRIEDMHRLYSSLCSPAVRDRSMITARTRLATENHIRTGLSQSTLRPVIRRQTERLQPL